MKHTPAPWKASFDNTFEIFSSKGDAIGQVYRLHNHDFEANARLIAAAPELLDALIGLLDVCHCTNDCDPNDMSCATNVARAAIAKATS